MSHQVVLTWTASTDMPNPIPSGSGYNIYRGTAPGAEGAIPINTSPIAANTFTDTSATVGVLDYYVKTLLNGALSVASAEVSTVILPQPPTGLTATSS